MVQRTPGDFGFNDYPTQANHFLEPFTAVSAGVYHSFAVTLDGKFVFGKLEHNRCNIAQEHPPVKAVAAGVRHTCALTRDVHLLCSGSGWYVPEALRTSRCQRIAAGEDVTCVLTAGHCTPVID